MIIVLYVDDGLVAGTDKEIELFLKQLRGEFQIITLSLDNFLGMDVKILEDGSIFLNQRGYADRILRKFNLADAKPVVIPSEGIQILEEDQTLDGAAPYHQAVGILMYLTTATGPDLAYAVSIESEKLNSPTASSWNAVERIYK